MKTAKYLTVLDYASGKVCVYSLSSWRIDDETVEDFIDRHHRVKDCEWMIHDNAPELWAKGLSYDNSGFRNHVHP
tara:strand:+ start:856 stop:1080 length:225 start_codon:yes stop_codon:yes gene_type:complete